MLMYIKWWLGWIDNLWYFFLYEKLLNCSLKINFISEREKKWSDMLRPIFGICALQQFNPSKCTHSSETHTPVNTHPEQWAANAAVPGEQLGVRSLALGSHLSHRIEGEREHWLFTPLTDNSCRRLGWDSNPWLLGYKSDSLSIRPWLPLKCPLLPISNDLKINVNKTNLY